MNKLFTVIAFMLVLLSSSALAATSSKSIQLSQFDVFSSPADTYVILNVKNTMPESAKGLHASAMIPELGLLSSTGPFSLSSGRSMVKQFILDTNNAASGDYYVRVAVGNGKARIVKYRIITIE